MASDDPIANIVQALVDEAESRFVADLAEEAARLLKESVKNPDRFAVLARLCPERLMGVLAAHRGSIDQTTWSVCLRELRAAGADMSRLLSAATAKASPITDYGRAWAEQAARGMGEIISRQNVALVDQLERTWYNVTAEAITRAELGDSFNDVMERAVRKLSDSGLETIDYRSGVKCSIDAATRRHVVTQANQARNSMLMDFCDEYGWDLVFTSAHYGARPDHAKWQGKVYSRSGGTSKYPALIPSTGYGTVTGLCGANCRHEMTPYIPGYSQLPDTGYSSQEAYFGKTSDEYYEATQAQRRLERNVRKLKRRISLGESQGLDMTSDRARLGVAQKKVRDWCRANKLPRDYSRERAWGVKKQPRALGVKKTVSKGAITGALNEHNDPSGSRRKKHAERYYEELRNRDRRSLVRTMSMSSGLPEEDVERAFIHVFINEHYLIDPDNPSRRKMQRFDPDYKMSQAWQRLCTGKSLYHSDIVLLQHEAAEAILMQSGMLYEDAHDMVCKRGYDYEKALDEDLKRRGGK